VGDWLAVGDESNRRAKRLAMLEVQESSGFTARRASSELFNASIGMS
jgi:hypothetical protein